MKRVIVHIDSLVLKGFRLEDRHAIGEGLRQELGRIFADPMAAERLLALGNLERLRVRGVPIAQGSSPQRVGEKVARGMGKEFKG